MAVSNINDKQFNFAPITLINRGTRVENPIRQIVRIDREINARENLITSNNEVISLTREKKVAIEKLITSNNESISLRKEYVQTLTESRGLDRKRIGLLEKQNGLYQELLDRRQSRRSNSVDVKDNFKNTEINKLDKKLTTLAKQDAILKEQTKTVDTKANKLALKLDHTEKQPIKLEAKTTKTDITEVITSKNKESKSSNAKNGLEYISTYQPSANHAREHQLLSIKHNGEDLQEFNKILEQRVYTSQKNIYESIVSNMLVKLV